MSVAPGRGGEPRALHIAAWHCLRETPARPQPPQAAPLEVCAAPRRPSARSARSTPTVLSKGSVPRHTGIVWADHWHRLPYTQTFMRLVHMLHMLFRRPWGSPWLEFMLTCLDPGGMCRRQMQWPWQGLALPESHSCRGRAWRL